MPRILVVNDDGIFSPGIKALAEAMISLGEIAVVAPDIEQSGVGHGITVRRPLRFKHTQSAGFGSTPAYRVDGTPADCVVLGVHNLFQPDLVVSGINIGSNLGYDLTRSGTVAAALEGTSLGIPSIAFSLRAVEDIDLDFSHAARYAGHLAAAVLRHGLPPKTLLNVNFPPQQPKGVRVTVHGEHRYKNTVFKRFDPEQREYYWVAGTPVGDNVPGTDFEAVKDGFISVTPIYLDFTHQGFLAQASSFVPELEWTEVALQAAEHSAKDDAYYVIDVKNPPA